jgi:hypothetical protein
MTSRLKRTSNNKLRYRQLFPENRRISSVLSIFRIDFFVRFEIALRGTGRWFYVAFGALKMVQIDLG